MTSQQHDPGYRPTDIRPLPPLDEPDPTDTGDGASPAGRPRDRQPWGDPGARPARPQASRPGGGARGGSDRGGADRGGLHVRLRAAALAAVGEARFVDERPASLREHLDYARRGTWTAKAEGRVRDLHLLWAWAVAIPVTAIAHLTVWSVRGPARAAAVWGGALVLASALNQIPVLEWLIPDWASIPDWF